MTDNDEQMIEIPRIFKLRETLPGENPIMQRRSFPAALRFHKVNQNNNPHKYFLSELMLYIPFRDEEKEFRPNDHDYIENLYKENQERIILNSPQTTTSIMSLSAWMSSKGPFIIAMKPS